MLTQVEVRNPAGDLLTLVLDDISDGYVLQDIQGLDPVKASIISSSFASLDGVQFQSAKREARNILVYLGLEPDYISTSVRDLRQNLYNWFISKGFVNLRFFDDDGPTVSIDGVVESNEAPLFAKDPQAVISIICTDPDFVDLDTVTGSGNTVSTTTEFLIDYDGTSETGIEFVLNVNRDMDGFTIFHRKPDNSVAEMAMDIELMNLDVLTINTNVGHKEITLTRSSVDTSALYGLANTSDWIKLSKGANHFRVYATGAAVPFDYEYTNRYGGL